MFVSPSSVGNYSYGRNVITSFPCVACPFEGLARIHRFKHLYISRPFYSYDSSLWPYCSFRLFRRQYGSKLFCTLTADINGSRRRIFFSLMIPSSAFRAILLSARGSDRPSPDLQCTIELRGPMQNAGIDSSASIKGENPAEDASLVWRVRVSRTVQSPSSRACQDVITGKSLYRANGGNGTLITFQ